MKTLHLLGLPHTNLVRDTVVCAFTAKAHKFVEMMQPRGYRIVAYWGSECDIEPGPRFEHVPVATDAERTEWFGSVDANVLPTLPVWDGAAPHWTVTNERMVAEIAKRVEPRDLILSLAGWNHKPVTERFPAVTACEWAAGYPGWCERFVCFESYAWMHHGYGARHIDDGRWYDVVIPNFFRPSDFPASSARRKRQDHLLYVGRLIGRKGILTAHEIARATGRTLVVAGSGAASYENETLTTLDGHVLPNVAYVGPVDAKQRNLLMSTAAATIVATTYVEPFGAVAVESQLCGTPVLATDWGAFPETVEHGKGGYRFRTLQEAVEAVNALDRLPSASEIRKAALAQYSLKAVAPRYDRWFRALDSLWGDGWYDTSPVRGKLTA